MAERDKGIGVAISLTIVTAVLVVGFVLFLLMMKTGAPAKPAPLIGPEAALGAPASDLVAQPAQAGQIDSAQPPAPPVPPPPGAATANVDGAFSFSDDSLSFSAAVPSGPANDPVLAYLRRSSESYLGKMKPRAREAWDASKRGGARGEPWEIKVKWDYTARAGGIDSLAGIASEFTGGAHPMQFFDTHIARARTGEQLKFDDLLLASRKPSPALVIAICEALKTTKKARINSATINMDPIVCAGSASNVNVEEAHIALAPSNQADKFGGVYVYYDPYKVGAYSEGAYKLTVQQEVFAEDLRPEFKPLFGGEAPVLKN